MVHRLALAWLIFAWFGTAAVLAGDEGAMVDNILALLESGHVEEAYHLADDHVMEQEGEPAFDFAYGLVALASGHANVAVFALERVLVHQPWNHRARLELARAYYELRDFASSKLHFKAVLRQKPPAMVRARIAHYLHRIDTAQRQARYQWYAQLGLTMGSDSNVNGATDQQSIVIPAFTTAVVLDDQSRKLDDSFSQWDGTFTWRMHRNKFTSWDISAGLTERRHSREYDFDSGNLHTAVAWRTRVLKGALQVPLQWHSIRLANHAYRSGYQTGLQWRRGQGHAGWGGFVLIGAQRYDHQSTRDINTVMTGLLANWRINARLFSQHQLFISNEQAIREEGKHHGRQYPGVSSRFQLPLGLRQQLFFSVSYYRADYAAEHPVFAVARQDDVTQVAAGWRWRHKGLQFQINTSFLQNDSNIMLYAYERTLWQASVNYQWGR